MRVSTIAESGLWSAVRALEVAASNVANVNTPGFVPARAVHAARASGGVVTTIEHGEATVTSDPSGLQPLSGTDLVSETVAQLAAARAFSANLAVLRTDQDMQAELVRTRR